MRHSHVLLFGANSFGIGLLAPVMSLVFLSHGATMETLSLCIGIFAVVVVVLELPSGILSDIIGRKKVFLLSSLFLIFYYLFQLFSHSFPPLACACIMLGAGRAFSSGTIEALEIEAYLDRHGSRSLEKINSQMAVIDSVGSALGSITGGILGFLDGSYKTLLLTAVGIQLLVLTITIFAVTEAPHVKSLLSPLKQLKNQFCNLGSTLHHSARVSTILCMSAVIGMLLCTIEIYWQPSLKGFLPAQMGWIFGIVNCLGFLGVSIGSKGMEFLINKIKNKNIPKYRWRYYWGFRFLLSLAIMALGLVHQVWLFILLFTAVYAILGAGNLIENTIFHAAVPNSQRASMMSILSLSTRAGGLITSVLGSLIISGLSLPFVWVFIPLFAAVVTGGIMTLFYKFNLGVEPSNKGVEPLCSGVQPLN